VLSKLEQMIIMITVIGTDNTMPAIPQMAPQIPPGRSLMVPKSQTYIDNDDFGDPRGSKVTPWVPKVTPQAPPGLEKDAFWVLKATPGASK
jgi:hypothetical protein